MLWDDLNREVLEGRSSCLTGSSGHVGKERVPSSQVGGWDRLCPKVCDRVGGGDWKEQELLPFSGSQVAF